MDLKIDNNGEACIMNLQGDVMIDDIDSLRQKMLEAFESSNRIILNVENVTDMDFFSIQFLCSAHRATTGLNKHFEISGNKSDAVKRLIRQSGFKREIGCVHDKDKTCFWISED